MIHSLLGTLDRSLPVYPPLIVAAIAAAIVALALSLYGRSRAVVLFCAAAGFLGLGLAVGLAGVDCPARPVTWGSLEETAETIVGPPGHRAYEQVTAGSMVVAILLLAAVYNTAFQERPGQRPRRQLEADPEQGQILGSARLCSPAVFRRWSRPDPWGWTLHGRFWGARGQPLGARLSLGGEDIARGVAVFGPQGSGKTQGVILPAIADRMRDRHSLVVTDVQGELQPYVEQIAAATGHLVVVHNPSDPEHSCAVNLCDMVHTVADAQAMAAVLLSKAHGEHEQFWVQAAINLLAACALHYLTFGEVMVARRDLRKMADDLAHSDEPGVVDLAADFVASMQSRDAKLALNIMAEAFNVGLAPWADPAIQELTARSDLDLAGQLTTTPTVVILRCARRHTDAYGPYLGTVLRVVTTRLDDLGEHAGGQLPIPVGLILEEFPALGRLDSLVRDINLVRKRRISVLTAAQSLSQFDHVYPARGEADRLMAGLATKVVFGGCDQRTADFFSRSSGQQTVALASLSRGQQRPGHTLADSATAHLQSRPLLLPDDVIRPAKGHATVFAAYSAGGRAEQAIFHAELTPFFRRRDWQLGRAGATPPMTFRAQDRDRQVEQGPEMPEREKEGVQIDFE